MRGWSQKISTSLWFIKICPAYAGVIPNSISVNVTGNNLSRVCGGDPLSRLWRARRNAFVPRMRGWSYGERNKAYQWCICPAYAGVIPQLFLWQKIFWNLSRVCGDDSLQDGLALGSFIFVPRMRGWSLCLRKRLTRNFICPAYAGVILVLLVMRNS